MIGLAVEQLSVTYTMARTGKTLTAVQDVSFDAAPGEFVALVGPSGCGKTTVLNGVAGLQPASSGRIRLDGAEVTGPGRERAMVFQAPALLPWRTVRGNVAYGLELHGLAPREAGRRVQPWLDLVGLGHFAESYPRELSGGMQQRVNLARALAVQPKLLLVDEPLSALDAQAREVMQLELQRIWLETRCSALYVTHQIDEAIFLADRIVVMSARPGRVQQVIPVHFPRPRSLALKRHPEFATISERIWRQLQPDHPLFSDLEQAEHPQE